MISLCFVTRLFVTCSVRESNELVVSFKNDDLGFKSRFGERVPWRVRCHLIYNVLPIILCLASQQKSSKEAGQSYKV